MLTGFFIEKGAYDRYDLKDGDAGIDKTVKRPSVEFTKDLNPDEFPELECPPLRKIDKYCQPECPCINLTKRYTHTCHTGHVRIHHINWNPLQRGCGYSQNDVKWDR